MTNMFAYTSPLTYNCGRDCNLCCARTSARDLRFDEEAELFASCGPAAEPVAPETTLAMEVVGVSGE